MADQIELTAGNLDSFIVDAEAILQRDGHSAWLAHVGNTSFISPEAPPNDPFGDSFSEFQLDLWRLVSGRRAYDPHNDERNPNLVAVKDITQSYPFSTGSTSEVFNYFSAVLEIYRHINLTPPASIVEFGVGWGHSTRFLANAGFAVAAVDIEPAFLDMLDRFSIPGAPPIGRQHCSFTDAKFSDGSLDAAVFFECFHHCLDHSALIGALSKSLKPGGKIVFASEAFYEDWFPYPWGLRLDGQAVWAIRTCGWMELGFRKSYIADLLARSGFECTWCPPLAAGGPYSEFMVATLRSHEDVVVPSVG